LYVYNGTSLLKLTNNNNFDSDFAGISNNNAVWFDRDPNKFYLYNGVRKLQLTGNSTVSENFNGVSDRYAVWQGYVSNENDYDLFAYNGARTIRLTNIDGTEDFLGVSNRYVAWSGFDGIFDSDTNDEFFAYNGRRNVKLTNDRTTSETFLNISDRYFVWSANDGNDVELYAYDGAKIIQLTRNNNNLDSLKTVSDNSIYWTSNDGTDDEIFVYNGFRTIQVTRNSTNDLDLTISGNNLFWRNFDGNDDELYAQNLSQYAPNIVVNNTNVVEGLNGLAVFTVSLSNAGTFPVTVRYSTANGTALAGRDYLARTGRLTFSPGQTTKRVAIRLLNNNFNERNETFSLRLRNSQNGLIADGLGISNISDILSSRVSRTLLPSVENLILTGTANTNGIGNAKNNFLIGNRGRNRLNGLAGNDVLTGASGNDRFAWVLVPLMRAIALSTIETRERFYLMWMGRARSHPLL
jgi:Calx-beta domain/RTX calcium-binding nonapeptide repeat (4 copies)